MTAETGPEYPLSLPPHYDATKVGEIRQIPYQEREQEAMAWAERHGVQPACEDRFKICLIAVDVQNTFCTPGFELYVAGRTGTGAVDDNQRLCAFIYRNLSHLTQICPTMDTHNAMQIFHRIFVVNDQGEHPPPFTLISEEDIRQGVWKFNPNLCFNLEVTADYGQEVLLHYTRKLREGGKYNLTIWPYHAMLGGLGHTLVAAVEEAIFFHSIARYSRPDFHIKGDRSFTEHYSVLGPEVRLGPKGEELAPKSEKFYRKLQQFDAVLIAGQAKSHCVAWTIADLLEKILSRDRKLVEKVYLLEDCTSPVVVPGVMDYTDQADAAFQKFAEAGMHVVRSVDPMESWPDMPS
ncbi:MAG: isochorismatase [Deltaproteobacteria bacterium]